MVIRLILISVSIVHIYVTFPDIKHCKIMVSLTLFSSISRISKSTIFFKALYTLFYSLWYILSTLFSSSYLLFFKSLELHKLVNISKTTNSHYTFYEKDCWKWQCQIFGIFVNRWHDSKLVTSVINTVYLNSGKYFKLLTLQAF